jgi:hypothetical protein
LAATTTSDILCYLIIPPVSVLPTTTADPSTVSPALFAAEQLLVYNFGEILDAENLQMVRAALGLRKTNRQTFRFALIRSKTTCPLATALWRWKLYNE